MTSYFELTLEQQRDVLLEAEGNLGMPAFLLEKDYWVCRVLDALFKNPLLNPHLCFRGGTSLSKVFHCIQRFSEDIDIALSPNFFKDISPEIIPSVEDSVSQRDRKHRKMRGYYRSLMEKIILPLLKSSFESQNVKGICFEMEDLSKARDPFVLHIKYPSILKEGVNSYITSSVKLELSGRAEISPATPSCVDSYLAQVFPEFSNSVDLTAILPHRTFWEKAFILHEENVRETVSKERLSRHYYDLASLIRMNLYDLSLFEIVKKQRALNYGYSWINYEGLHSSEMLIMPPNDRLYQAWKSDYHLMKPMLFGAVEEFPDILSIINQFVESELKA